MAIRKRFNPIKYYSGGGSAVRKPLTVKAPSQKYAQVKAPPQLSTAGHMWDKGGKFIADLINSNREEGIRSADQANVEKMIEALTAPRTPFSTEKYGTSYKDLMVAAGGYSGIEEDGEGQYLSDEAQREFYTEEADRVRKAYETGEPAGADLVRQQAKAGEYNMPTQSNWLAEQFGAEPSKGRMGPRSSDLMMKILLGDKSKTDAAELLAAGRAYDERVAERKIKGQIEVARAKPGTDPTRYKEWKLSGSKLSFEKWMERDDLRKIGLRPAGSGEPPTAIPGGPAYIKQEKLKLQEKSNALMRKRVTLMEQKMSPEHIKRIEEIRKSASYLIDLKKSRPKARGAVNTLKMKGEKVAAIVAEALPLAQSMFAAGPGSMLKGVWNTDSRRLAGLLTNLKAIIGFDTLAEMRANSPTGGALGQVSNIEINLLQAVQGTLDQGQQELLIRSLTDIKGNYPRLLSWAEERFKEQYAPLEEQGQSLKKKYGLK